MTIQEQYPGFCIKVGNFNLLAAYCPNNHLHIFGFWGQIREEQKEVDMARMKINVTDTCRECNCKVAREYDLIWNPDLFVGGAGI